MYKALIRDEPPFTFKHTPSEPIETPISITEDLIGEINQTYPKYQKKENQEVPLIYSLYFGLKLHCFH